MTFVNQTEVDFPEMTFCPEYYEDTPVEGPMAYNLTFLEECGVNGEDLYKGWYYGSQKCSAEDVLVKAHPRLEDFGIQRILVLSGDSSAFYQLNVNSHLISWKEWYLHGFGKCFTVNFHENITKSHNGISFVSFDAAPKHFRVYIHSSGLFGWPDFETGVAGLVTIPGSSYLATIEQEAFEYADNDPGECNDDPGYNRDDCVSDFVQKISKCVVPYGNHSSPLCQDWQQRSKAFEALKNGLFEHTGCPIPCRFIVHTMSSKNLMKTDQDGSSAVIWFKPLVKKSTFRITYDWHEFLGEVGGYVGLFLGFSVLMTQFLLDKIIFKAFWFWKPTQMDK